MAGPHLARPAWGRAASRPASWLPPWCWSPASFLFTTKFVLFLLVPFGQYGSYMGFCVRGFRLLGLLGFMVSGVPFPE